MLNAKTLLLLALVGAGPSPQSVEPEPDATAPPPRYVTPPAPRPEAPVPERIPSYFELTAEVRAELPDLELRMIRYDPDPEQRFVIMNGRRITEGLPAGRDLWVHEIRAGAVVMRFIDQYFLLTPR